MNTMQKNGLAFWRGISAAAVVAGLTIASASVANANGCPADQMGVDVTKAGATEPKDVTDNVLASIDLSKEMVALNDHQFRMRRLVIQPGGIVPWHNHADRPALIYIVQGEVTEYASDCKVPIVHKAGDVSIDAGLSHWWKNTGKKKVVLISADILHDKMDVNM